mmetsp:Transcript_78678/g.222407  ORF Transcript_78678/g.222407 Transcript_78678/m.222407 type:complete len:220 (-) Transcript_78678:138-797(-)
MAASPAARPGCALPGALVSGAEENLREAPDGGPGRSASRCGTGVIGAVAQTPLPAELASCTALEPAAARAALGARCALHGFASALSAACGPAPDSPTVAVALDMGTKAPLCGTLPGLLGSGVECSSASWGGLGGGGGISIGMPSGASCTCQWAEPWDMACRLGTGVLLRPRPGVLLRLRPRLSGPAPPQRRSGCACWCQPASPELCRPLCAAEALAGPA